jgi:predicted Zn-dependent peptidase
MEMLTDGLESPFMQEIREKRGLTYDVSADIDYATHFSVMWIGMVTDKKNVKTLTKLLEDMSLNITKYLTKDRFDALIDQYKTYSIIKKLFKYSKTDNLIEMEIPHMTDRVSDMSYDRVVATMQKYFSDIEIVVR